MYKERGVQGYDARYKLCQQEDEDIVHFIIKCKKLEQKRNYILIDRNIRDPEERMRVLLFRNIEYIRVSKMIRSLWDYRRYLLKAQTERVRVSERQERQSVNAIGSDDNIDGVYCTIDPRGDPSVMDPRVDPCVLCPGANPHVKSPCAGPHATPIDPCDLSLSASPCVCPCANSKDPSVTSPNTILRPRLRGT